MIRHSDDLSQPLHISSRKCTICLLPLSMLFTVSSNWKIWGSLRLYDSILPTPDSLEKTSNVILFANIFLICLPTLKFESKVRNYHFASNSHQDDIIISFHPYVATLP